MYRVQLFINENSRRVLFGSWNCPTEEAAEKKSSNLKSKYNNVDCEVVVRRVSYWKHKGGKK